LRNGEFVPSNLWEESIVLLQVPSSEEALEKAEKIGRSRSISYKTSDGDELTWEFFKVLQVFQISEEQFDEGIELFSRHLRTSEVDSLLVPFDD
jgi:hypothetical protein